MREVDWLSGDRRFPGELPLPGVASIVRVEARIQDGEKTHTETRYYVSSATLTAEAAGRAVRGHWGIQNRLHCVLAVTFKDDQSRLRKGFGAKNLAVVRHCAINLVRAAKDSERLDNERPGDLSPSPGSFHHLPATPILPRIVICTSRYRTRRVDCSLMPSA